MLLSPTHLPGDKYGDGITLIKYIKRHYPNLSIVPTMNNNPAILSAVSWTFEIEGIVLKQKVRLLIT